MNAKKTAWIVLVALVCCANVQARLLFLSSQESPLYKTFQQGFESSLAMSEQTPQISYLLAGALESSDALAIYDTIVVAGVEAAKTLAQASIGDSKVIYTMLPLSSYQWLKDNQLLADNHQVLFIDQPAYRFINLIKTALPAVNTLGYLHGDVSVAYSQKLEIAAKQHEIEIKDVRLNAEQRLMSTLQDLVRGSDAVVVLPDPYLFNRRTVQGLLLASLRQRKPVIAYSESYVKAGALMALFSSPEQIGHHTAELVSCIEQNCTDATIIEQYPKYFSVRVSRVISRQLGLTISPVEEIERQLHTLEPKHSP